MCNKHLEDLQGIYFVANKLCNRVFSFAIHLLPCIDLFFCSMSCIDMNRACDPCVKKRWFSDLVDLNDGHLMDRFISLNKQPLSSSSSVSGFKAKQGEAAETVSDEVPSWSVQRTLFIQHETWMEMFSLQGFSITPASFLLNFKPKQTNEHEEYCGDDSSGVLCLFSFNSKEYVCHWYDDCFCFILINGMNDF